MHLLVKKASRRWHRPLLGKLECVLQWQLLAGLSHSLNLWDTH